MSFFGYFDSPIMAAVPLALIFLLFILFLHDFKLGLSFLIFSIPLSPKITGIFGSEIPLRIDDIIIILLFMAWIMKLGRGEARLSRTPFSAPIITFFSFMIFSTVVGYFYKCTITNPKYSIFVLLKNFEYYAVFFLVANNIDTKEDVKRMLKLWMWAYFIVVMYGIGEQILFAPGRLYDTGPLYVAQSNHMGGYLMISTSIALALFIAAGNKREKTLYLILTLLSLYPFFHNGSKQSYVSLSISAFLIYLIFKPRLVLIPVFLILVLFFGIPILMPHAPETESIEVTKQDIMKGERANIRNPSSADVRRRTIARAIQSLPKNPFIGCGTGYKGLAWYDSQIPLLLFEDGIIGTAIFFWLLFTIFINSIRIFAKSGDIYFKAVSVAFFGSFLGVVIHSFPTPAWMVTLIIEPFWYLAGIVIAIDRINKKRTLYAGNEIQESPARTA